MKMVVTMDGDAADHNDEHIETVIIMKTVVKEDGDGSHCHFLSVCMSQLLR